MILQAYRNWRRDRILQAFNLDEALWNATVRHFPFAWTLEPADQERLRDLVVLFMHEKHWSAAAGLQLTAQMQVWVAVQACILILNLGLDYYRGWSGIVVYPAQFVPRHQHVDAMGVVHETDDPYMGEAWLGGPVVLSWEDAQGSEYPDGVNVVIHEFAHKLDMLNGDANGFPPLHADMKREAWERSFRAAYDDFCARVDRGEDTDIDPYASESPGEFFAVLSEAFFEIPDIVQHEYPAVYDQLAAFYKQDPAQRLAMEAVRLPG
ncbi:MAG TPA: M90 family metallopeptidase [Burkholderiales bacterium]|nr:M90 family metallopeptidase [Burkholderiales bacterium]